MTDSAPPRRGLRRLLGHSLFAGAGAVAVTPVPTVDASSAVVPDDSNDDLDEVDDFDDVALDDAILTTVDSSDPTLAGYRLAMLLEQMSPFDATRVASIAAISDRARVRCAIANALTVPFRLVGDDFILGQLVRDGDPDVRVAADRASRLRLVPAATPRHPRVLVIDDYVGGRAALCACLNELGCDSIGTSSKIASAEVAWREVVDVLVANHDPPWSDGEQLLVELRRHAPDLPAILVSSSSQPAPLPSEITLVKPIQLAQLADAIDKLGVKKG